MTDKATSTPSGIEPIKDDGFVLPDVKPVLKEVVFKRITLPKTLTELKVATIDLSSEEKQQEDYKKIKGKYCQVKEVVDGDVKKSITEYVCPNGSTGYQIILRKMIGEDEYIMSTGYGKEAKERTQNWTKVIKEEII